MDSQQQFPDDCAKQWDVWLMLLAQEEQEIGIRADGEVDTMSYFCKRKGINAVFQHWLAQMQSSYAKKVTNTDTATKCEAISLFWKQKGNDCFKIEKIDDSYNCYNKSILYAEPHGLMYPLAMANRSAALFHMNRFENCLMDIEIALSNGYPINQQCKLFLRQGECYVLIGQSVKAEESLELAKKSLQPLNEKPSISAHYRCQINELEKKIQILKKYQNETPEPPEPPPPTYLEEENINFVCATKSLVLREREECGRHVITEKPVQRGDVLFDEKAYAFVALPIEDNLPLVCEACGSGEDFNAVPCKKCSRSVYCSEKCRDEGWKVFHQWECVGAQAILFPTIGIAHLALRVLLVSADKGFPPIETTEGVQLKVADVFKEYSKFDRTQIYQRGVPEFYRMFYLVTNFEKMDTMDFLQYALTATMLTLYLEHYTSFFEHLRSQLPYSLGPEDIKLFCAAMLLRHMGQLVCNGHAAYMLTFSLTNEFKLCGNGSAVGREQRYLTAIYPSTAMMNHSCDHNTINTFYRDRLVIRCGRDVAAGGEIQNCYGPHKSRETYDQRQSELLHQYCFACKCETCQDLERRNFVLLFSAYSCQRCKGPVICEDTVLKCQQCKTTSFDIDRAIQISSQADKLLREVETSEPDQVCIKFHAMYQLKQLVLYKHNTELRATANELARLYSNHGENGKSIEILKENIQSAEFQYGSFSGVVTHELNKLAGIMLNRIFCSPKPTIKREWCLETSKVLNKGIKLMDLNYGPWERQILPLRRQLKRVAALVAETWPDVDSLQEKMHYNLKI